MHRVPVDVDAGLVVLLVEVPAVHHEHAGVAAQEPVPELLGLDPVGLVRAFEGVPDRGEAARGHDRDAGGVVLRVLEVAVRREQHGLVPVLVEDALGPGQLDERGVDLDADAQEGLIAAVPDLVAAHPAGTGAAEPRLEVVPRGREELLVQLRDVVLTREARGRDVVVARRHAVGDVRRVDRRLRLVRHEPLADPVPVLDEVTVVVDEGDVEREQAVRDPLRLVVVDLGEQLAVVLGVGDADDRERLCTDGSSEEASGEESERGERFHALQDAQESPCSARRPGRNFCKAPSGRVCGATSYRNSSLSEIRLSVIDSIFTS